MRARKLSGTGTKMKVGTILDAGIIEKLKLRALRERKPMSAVIEEAVLSSESVGSVNRDIRLKAFESFLAVRFNLTGKQWDAVMEEDVYEQ